MRRRWWLWLAIAVVVAFGAIQLVPYRVSNPPTRDEPAWDSPRTRALAKVACFDCHSNESNIVWWEKVAPLSWWINNHVDDGREKLNFSEWSTRHGEGIGDSVETITGGSMPPDYYTWLGMHSNAKLTPTEKQQLVDGLRRTAARSKQGAAATGG